MYHNQLARLQYHTHINILPCEGPSIFKYLHSTPTNLTEIPVIEMSSLLAPCVSNLSALLL